MKRSIGSLLVVLLMLFLTATTADAHANLLSAVPADGEVTADSPVRIALSFSEPLEAELIDLLLYDPAGTNIPLEPPQLAKGDATQMFVEPPPLAVGSYTVVWTVVSEDGHPITDRYSFSVGQPTPGFALYTGDTGDTSRDRPLSQILLLAARYLAEGMLLTGGGLYAVGRIARRCELPAKSDLLGRELTGTDPYTDGRCELPSMSDLLGRERTGTDLNAVRRCVLPSMGDLLGRARPVLWGLLLAATLAEWLIYSAGLPTSLATFLQNGDWHALFQSSFVTMVSVQTLLLLLLALPGMVSGWQTLIWTLLVGNLAFGGHAFGIEPVWLALTLRVLHLLATALWIGGVLYLLLVAFQKKRDGASAVPQGAFRSLFLRVVLSASLLTVLTGVLMVGVQTDWATLLPSTLLWRDLLLIKALLTLALFLIAFFQTKRWRTNAFSLSRPLLRGELLVFAAVILLAVWLSQIEHPLPH